MMSTKNNQSDDDMMCCASCGIAEVDDIELKTCCDCKSVRYCSDNCQQEHFEQHEQACKERAAELLDEILFKQPESSHLGDCPICLLPLPIDPEKSISMGCCSKLICDGCDLANQIRELEGGLNPSCPFCRYSAPTSREEDDMNRKKRIEANDPVAMCNMGTHRSQEGDYEGAFRYWTKAAELGDAVAHYQLSCVYNDGIGAEKDEKKELHHMTEAAISGHPNARYNLAACELRKGRIDRAVKHWIIAANLGCGDSIKALKLAYVYGDVSKEDFAAALRAHQAAIDATKSPQREAAEADRKKQVGQLPK